MSDMDQNTIVAIVSGIFGSGIIYSLFRIIFVRYVKERKEKDDKQDEINKELFESRNEIEKENIKTDLRLSQIEKQCDKNSINCIRPIGGNNGP